MASKRTLTHRIRQLEGEVFALQLEIAGYREQILSLEQYRRGETEGVAHLGKRVSQFPQPAMQEIGKGADEPADRSDG